MNIKLLTFVLVLASGAVRSFSLDRGGNVKWTEWKRLHGKSYVDSYEENFRHAVWRYKNKNTLPKEVDWRKKGCVTSVKNQGVMSGSWAFSAVGSLEGRHCIVTKQLKSLNVTKLDECCTSCESVVDAFGYMIAHRHAENSLISTGNEDCNFSTAAYGASLTGFSVIPHGNEMLLQAAVAVAGPVSVTIDASHPSFQMYVDGVYDEPSCSSTQLDHAVLVVGYGTLNGKDYWLVKNSWGVNWGMEGYIMMARNKSNQCGIATEAVYPTGVSFENLIF